MTHFQVTNMHLFTGDKEIHRNMTLIVLLDTQDIEAKVQMEQYLQIDINIIVPSPHIRYHLNVSIQFEFDLI